jgi:hypothetical protein
VGGGGIHCADAGAADTEELFMSKANEALDKMAENAKQVGLDYEPAQRPWVSLTDEEVVAVRGLNIQGGRMRTYRFARAIEAKLKEKNT